jgi:hypothetical protein
VYRTYVGVATGLALLVSKYRILIAHYLWSMTEVWSFQYRIKVRKQYAVESIEICLGSILTDDKSEQSL